MDVEEFNKKVNEIWDKIDYENNSYDKNLIFLKSLKNICAHTLEEPNPSQELEEAVKKNLFKVESEISKLKSQQPNIPTSPFQQQKPQPLGRGSYSSPFEDEKTDPLESVDVGGFDPSSSPILRNLKPRATVQSKLETEPAKQSELDVKNQEKPELNIEEFPPIPSSQDIPSSPFPTTPEITARLEFPQLEKTISIQFSGGNYELNKRLFTLQEYSQKIPDGFFDSILEKNHAIIETLESGKFLIKDPLNQQKTYYKNQFVDDKGLPIQEGDEFILPVLVNNSQSSLRVIFHSE